MSGRQLRIRSERTPYRRAGLAWGEERSVELALEDLSGGEEQLLELALDPALRLELLVEGRFVPLRYERDGLTIDSLAAAFALAGTDVAASGAGSAIDVGDAAPRLSAEEVDELLDSNASLLKEVERLQDEVTSGEQERQALQSRCEDLAAKLGAAETGKVAAERAVDEADRARGVLEEQLAAANERVADLEAKLAAPPPSKPPKTKIDK